MDLKDGKITLNELLSYPPARALLSREFPQMIHHPAARIAGGMPLKNIICMAGDALPAAHKEEILEKLRKL